MAWTPSNIKVDIAWRIFNCFAAGNLWVIWKRWSLNAVWQSAITRWTCQIFWLMSFSVTNILCLTTAKYLQQHFKRRKDGLFCVLLNTRLNSICICWIQYVALLQLFFEIDVTIDHILSAMYAFHCCRLYTRNFSMKLWMVLAKARLFTTPSWTSLIRGPVPMEHKLKQMEPEGDAKKTKSINCL